ncbi:MAG: hypothetical protein A3F91_15205 [Flavobacteria bacterium RIFCSPLOWO2_12_FULL_35_11]|nr:MAG: hypothetical protein A3F91_15205 [Flavobacteria bacterium RIFCSPLOWO2_12_FULL_35_11]
MKNFKFNNSTSLHTAINIMAGEQIDEDIYGNPVFTNDPKKAAIVANTRLKVLGGTTTISLLM